MRKIAFKDSCVECGDIFTFYTYSTREICPKINFMVITIKGGLRAYSFREIAVLFGIKKQIKIGQCEHCQAVAAKCPHCNTLMDKNDAISEKCPKCKKSFYLCI